jgi:hypothetical protein
MFFHLLFSGVFIYYTCLFFYLLFSFSIYVQKKYIKYTAKVQWKMKVSIENYKDKIIWMLFGIPLVESSKVKETLVFFSLASCFLILYSSMCFLLCLNVQMIFLISWKKNNSIDQPKSSRILWEVKKMHIRKVRERRWMWMKS